MCPSTDSWTPSDDDKPVCTAYKFAVQDALRSLPHGATLRQEVRWVNGLSFSIAVSDVNKAVSTLSSLPFVKELDLVGRTVRPNFASSDVDITTETTSTHQDSSLERDAEDSMALNYGESRSQLERIGIPTLHSQGYNGSGVIITVLDTGFNRQHQSLSPLTVNDVYDFVYNDTNVSDEGYEAGASNHGTAAWSNIGARAPGNLYGGSYDAAYLLCKTEDTRSETSVEEDNFARAIEWSEQRGADILSASLGYDSWHSWSDFDGKSSIIARVGNRAVDLGMLFVVANGNAGESGIGTPADMDRVLALGALGETNDAMAGFSSRGPTFDGRIKPDVSAPGVSVRVADFQNIAGYKKLSGTSFATPLTAGVAGLLLQANPTWTNRQLRDAILYTATPKGGSPNNVFGFGVVNAADAVSFAPQTQELLQTLCVAPYGSWDAQYGKCACSSGYYNSDCRTETLACSAWCPGLCESREATASCLCSASVKKRCTRNTVTESRAWTCDRARYNDGSSCDCNCGLYDPDCNNATLPISGCTTSTQTCTNNNNAAVCFPDASPAPLVIPQEPTTPPVSEAPTEEKKHRSFLRVFLSLAVACLTFLVR